MHLKNKMAVLLAGMYVSAISWAFPCYLTVAKDTCWTNYNVTIQAFDAQTNALLTTVMIPTDSSWRREKFTCQPSQKIRFAATFSPIIWEQDKGRVYAGTDFWSLPDEPKADELAWNIPLCFSAQFSELPLPPTATGHCRCETGTIPPIEPL